MNEYDNLLILLNSYIKKYLKFKNKYDLEFAISISNQINDSLKNLKK